MIAGKVPFCLSGHQSDIVNTYRTLLKPKLETYDQEITEIYKKV